VELEKMKKDNHFHFSKAVDDILFSSASIVLSCDDS
jgi:hypothetical protein